MPERDTDYDRYDSQRPTGIFGVTLDPTACLFGVMVLVAAGVFVVLRIGFAIHHDPAPELLANNTLFAVAIVTLSIGGIAAAHSAIVWAGKEWKRAVFRGQARESAAERAEVRRQRADEMAADPRRAKYAPLVERGEDWSDEQIDYCENREATATCEHLRPIEQAIRRTGITVRLRAEGVVTAQCRIDAAGLHRVFNPLPVVRYAEFFQGERAANDFPTTFLICDEHKSIIHTLHPSEAHAGDDPLFPSSQS